MKKLLSFMLLMNVCIAANAAKEADIDYIELKANDEIKTTLIAEGIGRATVELTIEPEDLTYTNKKGLKITDANGEEVVFTLSREHYSAILLNGTPLDASNYLAPSAENKYRFVFTLSGRSVQVQRITSSGMINILYSLKVLTPPFNYSLFVEENSVKFHDVIVTSY